MAYSTDNPPICMTQSLKGTHKIWFYASTDTGSDVRVSGYFSNGYDLGMRAGDFVISVDTDASPLSMRLFIVSEATSSVVDLSDGTAVTATDTD